LRIDAIDLPFTGIEKATANHQKWQQGTNNPRNNGKNKQGKQ
jgi:hypothetical protein